MHKKLTQTTLICAILILQLTAIAQTDQRAETIAPFIDDQTIAIAHIDVSQIDIDAYFTQLDKVITPILPAKDKQEALAEIEPFRLVVKNWITDFIAAGGKDIYGVMSMADFPKFFLIAPMAPNANAGAMTGHLRVIQPAGPMNTHSEIYMDTFTQYKNVIFCGSATALKRIKEQEPVNRPELTTAFTATSNNTAQLLFIPNPDSRKVIGEMLPAITATAINQTPNAPFWATADFNGPPAIALNAIIQTQSPQVAKAIDNLIANMMATLHKEPPIKAVFPKLQDLIDAFPINVKNSRLSLHFNNEQTISLFNDIIAKAFQSAQKNAHRAMAMNNLKQIAIAFNMYAEDNKSELPDNINQLLPYLKDKKILTNPRQPNRDIGFIYVKPAVSIKDIKYPSRCIIAYEYHETWPDNGLCAAFADGHAETIANEAHFKELRE